MREAVEQLFVVSVVDMTLESSFALASRINVPTTVSALRLVAFSYVTFDHIGEGAASDIVRGK